ncbi:TetR/AcrR family transcriptional regulator [Leucobacter japonicus]|uniref:TetR/AcrR family transcriptional regulator n=1 Tax=Leucobacter japonicus TaxID=1461259 RepID=UPI000949A25C|nr:TetR family transcriptional regulator [Leucobacter japonicus]
MPETPPQSETQPAPQRVRDRLDHARVVQAAIALADAEGLDALSMRSLAAQLGVVPMALYKHVANKDDLIGAMIDTIVAAYADPPPGGSWRERVRARVFAARDQVLAHPWLAAAIESRTRRTEPVLAHMNAIAGEFIEGGISPHRTHYAMHALGTRIWGFSREAFDDPDAPTTDDADQPAVLAYMRERYPFVVQIALDAAQRSPAGCDSAHEFGFALDLVLDAAEAPI